VSDEAPVRRAREDDLAAVMAVHRASIVELCSAVYSPAQIAQWAGGISAERYAKLFEERRMFVCERADAILGFGILDVIGGRVFAVYVSPLAVREGVGRRLLEAMEDEARAAGVEWLELHATLNAVPFYERAGYASNGETVVRLSSGVELASVKMSKWIANAK
jgi:putative acetyltransferase